jgi:hypothetical protein
MNHKTFQLDAQSLTLCPAHASSALMWLWQEFDGTWSAREATHHSCDACQQGTNVPVSLRAALKRQADAHTDAMPLVVPPHQPSHPIHA